MAFGVEGEIDEPFPESAPTRLRWDDVPQAITEVLCGLRPCPEGGRQNGFDPPA
jgi:hypothetical protein